MDVGCILSPKKGLFVLEVTGFVGIDYRFFGLWYYQIALELASRCALTIVVRVSFSSISLGVYGPVGGGVFSFGAFWMKLFRLVVGIVRSVRRRWPSSLVEWGGHRLLSWRRFASSSWGRGSSSQFVVVKIWCTSCAGASRLPSTLAPTFFRGSILVFSLLQSITLNLQLLEMLHNLL